MKLQFIITAAMLLCLGVPAQARHVDFGTHFSDTTLRLNYIFSGNAACQHIAVSNYCKSAHWWGKRHRLAQVPVEGNGQLTMRLHRTGEVIYRNSFSTLFQEWLTSPEAQVTSRAFENVFLVPMPVDTVDVTVDLRDSRHRVAASLTHQVVPSDILTRNTDAAGTAPHVVVQRAADSLRCIHIAYVAEGYTQAEMATFLADVDKANEALFAHEPFKSNRNKFSIVAVTAPSAQSGTSEPGNGVWRNTLLQSHFDTFYSDRYLTTLALNRLHDVLAGIPYEHIIVLVNSSKYGGGGILNSYDLSSTHHKAFAQVIVHEFGHSFAGLADEYAYAGEEDSTYPRDVEPWEPNITTLAHFKGKWEQLVASHTPVPTPVDSARLDRPGLYEGAGYSLKGVYRAYPDCRMRSNAVPYFCPVCRQAIERVIDFYTAPEAGGQ